MKIIDTIKLFLATIGACLGWFLGDVDGFIYTLIAFVVADYITGVLRAISEKELSSKIGARGIVKKVMIFIIVGIAHLVDMNILTGGQNVLRTAVIFFYISNEGISIIENSSVIGLPVPKKLKDILAQIKEGKDE